MSKGADLDGAYLALRFRYEPDTGRFFRVPRKGRPEVEAKSEGNNHRGYRKFKVGGKKYYAHRIAWALTYGSVSGSVCIDHINRDRADNRLSNLRIATDSQNCANRLYNREGLKGAYYNQQMKKWVSYIGSARKKYYVGTFDTEAEANEAYLSAARKMFGEFARAA